MPTLTAIIAATDQPPTLAACLDAIQKAAEPPEELIVVEAPYKDRPPNARNTGAARATGEVLVFIDADVLVHPDVFVRIRRTLSKPDAPAGVIGSYDDSPAAPGHVSRFRNLLHHYVHTSSPGDVPTFWTGLGAVRRRQFLDIGGLDSELFGLYDIKFGMDLTAAGFRVELDPEIRGQHLKHWTLRSMSSTDLIQRGMPWLSLLIEYRQLPAPLSLGWRHKASALLSVAGLFALAARRARLAATAGLAFVWLNRGFYALLHRQEGSRAAAAGVVLHVYHHAIGAAAVGAGAVAYATDASWRGASFRPTPTGRNGHAAAQSNGRPSPLGASPPSPLSLGAKNGGPPRNGAAAKPPRVPASA